MVNASAENHAGPNKLLKRLTDIIVAAMAIIILSPIMICVGVAIRLTSNGPALYWSKRVGRNNALFWMPKFRTMLINTPTVATHLLTNPTQHLTPLGRFLRKTSIDEIPQLWCILLGEMSFVGPRPALYNQYDLIEARTVCGVSRLAPGLTGWAQVNGRDDLTTSEKVAYDLSYYKQQNFFLDIKIISLTFIKVFSAAGVKH